jgi:hypothetical protein
VDNSHKRELSRLASHCIFLGASLWRRLLCARWEASILQHATRPQGAVGILRALSQNYEACLDDFFHKEKTAVLIAGAEAYSEAQQSSALSESIRDHIGVAAIPGVSWIGGDHLVIWKTVRFDPRKEHAALDLIHSLTSVENQIRLSRETTILPARLDAYAELEFQPDGLRPVLEKILQTARPHPPARLWRRIESMLADMLCDIARTVMNFRNQTVAEIVETKLAEYEKRFLLLLGG